MANVLMLSLLFPPDNVSTAHLMGDVACDLVAAGHSVTVITTTPHYNPDPSARARQPLWRRWGRLLQHSTYHGVPVYHTLMPPKSGSSVLRVMAWGWFHALSVLVGLVVVGRVDVILTPSPPLSMGLVSSVLGRLKRAPFVYSVLELHPDIAISLGLVRRPSLIRMLYALERYVYRRAAHLTVIAPAMLRRVIEKGVPQTKVTLIPNFVDLESRLVETRPNAFSRAHGLDGKFVVSYAGNVGPAQGLESLLDAAALLRGEERICLAIIGGGIVWGALAARIRSERLSNVLLLPHQSFDVVPQIYGSADVCVVPQSATTTSDAVPSKVYRIMGAARPVLALTTESSDLATLVRDARCGEVVPADDPAAIAGVVRHACEHADDWRSRGARGRTWVEQHYSRPVVTRQYHRLVVRYSGEPDDPAWPESAGSTETTT